MLGGFSAADPGGQEPGVLGLQAAAYKETGQPGRVSSNYFDFPELAVV